MRSGKTNTAIAQQRQNTLSADKLAKMKKVNSVGPFKNIENNLDGFISEMEKIWKTGAMKIGLMKNNPTLDSKFIIGPMSAKMRSYSP